MDAPSSTRYERGGCASVGQPLGACHVSHVLSRYTEQKQGVRRIPEARHHSLNCVVISEWQRFVAHMYVRGSRSGMAMVVTRKYEGCPDVCYSTWASYALLINEFLFDGYIMRAIVKMLNMRGSTSTCRKLP